jgi:hypothetical protein
MTKPTETSTVIEVPPHLDDLTIAIADLKLERREADKLLALMVSYERGRWQNAPAAKAHQLEQVWLALKAACRRSVTEEEA